MSVVELHPSLLGLAEMMTAHLGDRRAFSIEEKHRIQQIAETILAGPCYDARTRAECSALTDIRTGFEYAMAGGLLAGFWETRKTELLIRDVLTRVRSARTTQVRTEELGSTLRIYALRLRERKGIEGGIPAETLQRIQNLSESIMHDYMGSVNESGCPCLGADVVLLRKDIETSFSSIRYTIRMESMTNIHAILRFLGEDAVNEAYARSIDDSVRGEVSEALVRAVDDYNGSAPRGKSVLVSLAKRIYAQCLQIEKQERFCPSLDREREALEVSLSSLRVRCKDRAAVMHAISRIAQVLKGKTLTYPLSLQLKEVTLGIIGSTIIVKDRYARWRTSTCRGKDARVVYGDPSARLGEGQHNRIYRAFCVHLEDLSAQRTGLQRPSRRSRDKEDATYMEGIAALHGRLREEYADLPLVTFDMHKAMRVSIDPEGAIECKSGFYYGEVLLHSGDGCQAVRKIAEQKSGGYLVKAQKNAIKLLQEVIEAYKLLGARGLVHMDVKPENIIIDWTVEEMIKKVWIGDLETLRRQPFIRYGDICIWLYQLAPEGVAQLAKHVEVAREVSTCGYSSRNGYYHVTTGRKREEMILCKMWCPSMSKAVGDLLRQRAQKSEELLTCIRYAEEAGYSPRLFTEEGLDAFADDAPGDPVELENFARRFHVKIDPRSEAFSVGFMLVLHCMEAFVSHGVFPVTHPVNVLMDRILLGEGGTGGLLDPNPLTRMTLAQAEELFLAGIPEELRDPVLSSSTVGGSS